MTRDELRGRYLGPQALRRFAHEMGISIHEVRDVGDVGSIVGRAVGRVRAENRERAWDVADAILTELDAGHGDAGGRGGSEPADREAAWTVFTYELGMFEATKVMIASAGLQDGPLKNAIVESSLLHLRILCEMLVQPTRDDDLGLEHLGVSVDSALLDALRSAYNAGPRITLNKRLAHATKQRTAHFVYDDMITELRPALERIAAAILAQRAE